MSSKKKPENKQIENKAPQTTSNPVTDIFGNLGAKAPLFALAALMFILFIVFKDYLFQQKIFLFKDIASDSSNFSYPYITLASDYIAKYGLPKWSFTYGMGQNLFPFLLRDPFDIFLYMAGKDRLIYGLIYAEVTKILLGGIVFYYYLKTIRLSDYTAIMGSMLFSFCGFIMVGASWYIFSFEALEMALLLLSFELLFTKKSWYLFPLTIFLICISQPFNLYVYGIFLAIYAASRYLQTESPNAKGFFLLYLQMLGLGLLGIMISGPFLLENIVQLLESPRGSGTTSYAHVLSSQPMFSITNLQELGTSFLRLFSSDILGTGTDFKGWNNFLEAPVYYCGLPCLLLMPQVFQFLDKRRKIIFAIFLALWILPVFFPYFRFAYWLFTGDYYRAYSFIVAIVFLYYSLLALNAILEKKKINLIVLIASLVVLFIMLNYPYFPDKEVLNPPVYAFVSIMLIVYAALLYFMSRPGSLVYLKYAFFVAVILELSYLSHTTVNDRDPITAADLSEKIGYNDYTLEAVKYIHNVDRSFYRIDKSYASSPAMHYSLNDAMAQGYYGTSEYNSFNQVYYVKYLQLMGISEKGNEIQARWAYGLINRPLLETQNSVKYVLAKKVINPIWKVTCDLIATFGDVKVYHNKYLAPFGYTHNYFIKQSVFDGLNNIQKDFISIRACVVRDEDISKVAGLKEFQLRDTIAPATFNEAIFRQYVDNLSKDTLTVTKFNETSIGGRVNPAEDKVMYLSVPYDDGWKLKVDGHPQDKIILNAGMTGIMLPKGQHTIEMTYELRYFTKGLYLCILGIGLYAGLWFFMKKRKVIE